MYLFHRTSPAPTPATSTPPGQLCAAQPRGRAATLRRVAQHALRVLACGLLTGAATTAGKTAMDIVIAVVHRH